MQLTKCQHYTTGSWGIKYENLNDHHDSYFLNYMYILGLLSKYLSTFCWNPPNGSRLKRYQKATLMLTRSLLFSKLNKIPTKWWSTVYLSGCQCKGVRLMGGIDITNTFSDVFTNVVFCFIALRPKSTAMVMAMGKLEQAANQYFVHILLFVTVTDNNSSWMIQRKGGQWP